MKKNTPILSLLKTLFFVLFFFSITQFSFSQSDDIVAVHQLSDMADSIYFHSEDASAITSDMYVNGLVSFADLTPTSILDNFDCNTPFIQTNDFGHNMFFKGKIFEVGSDAKFLGPHVLSFDHTTQKQTIYNPLNTSGTDTFRLTNLQVNNPLGVDLKNENISVGENVNFAKGKFVMTNGNSLELLNNARITCFSGLSYVVTNSDSKVIQLRTSSSETIIPIGTNETIAMARIAAKQPGLTPQNVKLSFNVDTFSKKDKTNYATRYDETSNLQWKIKNLTKNQKDVVIDSLKFAISKKYIDGITKKSNFIPSSAFITQFSDQENNVHGGDTSLSKWDYVPLSDFKPRLSYVLPYALSTPMVMYTRSVKLDLQQKPLQENLFTITNLNATPVSSKIIGVKNEIGEDPCRITLKWKPTDIYYSNLEFTMYLTNDITTGKGVLQALKTTDINLTNSELSTSFSLNGIISDPAIFSTTQPIYLKLLQTDKYGPEVSSSYTTIPVTCTTKLDDLSPDKEPVVYAEKNGENVTLHVEYMAKYTEEVNFKLYNILGMEEADLGSKTIANKPNKVSFVLPGNITSNQRYILVIYGGILNSTLTRKALSVFIP